MRKTSITAEDYSDETVAQKCVEATGKPCSNPSWKDYTDTQSDPENEIVAIIVDMRSVTGLCYIYNKHYQYKDMVGKESEGEVVIVPWKKGLKFVCYGSCRVGTVKVEEVDTR
ncbi:hypothetical protein BGZ63DRAFT_379443 [Mariannaea sp. PMI_226]|nr:hypothetical protein BGZ63DRAFT_379443 [Mariannaea sp. PMI_226]